MGKPQATPLLALEHDCCAGTARMNLSHKCCCCAKHAQAVAAAQERTAAVNQADFERWLLTLLPAFWPLHQKTPTMLALISATSLLLASGLSS